MAANTDATNCLEPEKATKTEEERVLPNKERKASPFLTSSVPTNENDDENEDEMVSRKKQYEEIDKATGSSSLFNSTCKLYFHSQKTKKFETRGEGKMIILPDKSGLFKLLMIRDQVMLVGCNHYISKASPLKRAKNVKNSWAWVAFNDQSDAETKTEHTPYFVTFPNEEDSEQFAKVYEECQIKNAELAIKMRQANKKEDKKDTEINK